MPALTRGACADLRGPVDSRLRHHINRYYSHSALRACLLTGDVSVRQGASRLATSPRTLRRRLAAGQTSFDELRDQTRPETACHLLENSEASITRIADLLGYAHSSALSRAFRPWTKLTPREWRVRMTSAGQ